MTRRRLVRSLAIVAVGLAGAWTAVNVVTGYATANPWVTNLLWQPPDRAGAIAAAVPGTEIDDGDVIGWHSPATTADRGTVVLVHGFGDDRNAPPLVTVSKWLHEAGFGVLAINLGYLDGRHRYTAGHREAADISAAIDWLDQRNEALAGLWGFSAGGHAALIATARDPRIPAVIADSAFVDGDTQVRRIASAMWKIPASSFLLTGAAIDLFSGDSPTDVRSIAWPGTPTLIVHGERDHAVPFSDAAAARDHTGGTLLALPDVDHTDAHIDAPDRYRTAALALLDNTRTDRAHSG